MGRGGEKCRGGKAASRTREAAGAKTKKKNQERKIEVRREERELRQGRRGRKKRIGVGLKVGGRGWGGVGGWEDDPTEVRVGVWLGRDSSPHGFRVVGRSGA